ncbi:Protein of unknown function [Cruoricaptor ignavus]|uniref:Antitoxin SocA-like Panacea domain-containing protein n=1 Tax=Cruoricaptor ignavus TaxID=1118202 RepID=A0A1M6H314_9FLAO|nr:Panacea domain-containing protein [Cruoricaptor ignavus]SHJ16598.1 Protein of unknown function [Cruoricaptor ignavus]
MSIQVNNIKVGNTLIYLRNRLPELYLTKALKLLYILDETSIKETGVPFTWMDYKAWKMGPVPSELYDELQYKIPAGESDSVLSKFVDVKKISAPPHYESDLLYPIESVSEFCDDEFSDYEIELMDRILNEYGDKSASDIIRMLHEKGSLWDKVVQDNNLEYQFRLMQNKSNFTIPFTDLLKDDELKQMAYASAFDSNDIFSEFSI